MADLTTLAFELAGRYRNPAVVLTDGFIGQMMEPVEFAPCGILPAAPDWAVRGTAESRRNLVSSIHLEPDSLERHIRKLEAKYHEAERCETRAETFRTDDADFILVGYGIMGRVLKAVVELARARGIRAGLLRPITLYPFPTTQIRALAKYAKGFAVVELSTGQLVDDVRLALEGRVPLEFFSRVGGNAPSSEDVFAFLQHKWGRAATRWEEIPEEVVIHG
jgi:pyruvate/2-oxoacid:ferredoxin oxidoreductase alpha subunit